MRRGMNGKPLFPTGAGEDITVPIVRIAPKGWAASRKHGLTCLGNGIMGRTPKHRKIVLRGPTKKYGEMQRLRPCVASIPRQQVLRKRLSRLRKKAARLRGPVGWFSYTSLKFQNIDFNRPLQRKSSKSLTL